MFCNVDVVNKEEKALTAEDLQQLKHHVGKTDLLNMPVSIDLLTKHKKSSLRENSIKFDKKPKTGRYEIKKKVVLSPDMTLEKLEEERRKREAEIAFV